MVELAIQEINHAMDAVRVALTEAEVQKKTKSIRRLNSVQNKLYSAMSRLLDELNAK